jgi:ribonuclease PH
MEFVSIEGLRQDGRRASEHRFCLAKFENAIARTTCDGSAQFQLGQTFAIASVFGPSQSQSKAQEVYQEGLKVTCECSSTSFASELAIARVGNSSTNGSTDKEANITKARTQSLRSERRNKEIAKKFERILTTAIDIRRFPRSELHVSCACVNDDGSAIACMFNAVVLALVDAGVPTFDTYCAMCATRLDGEKLLDCNDLEERGRGVEVFCVSETRNVLEEENDDDLGNFRNVDDTSEKRIVYYEVTGGKCSAETIDGLIRLCVKGSEDVSKVMRVAMNKRFRRLQSTRY